MTRQSGSSAIKTPVNISTVRTAGIEVGLAFNSPLTPFSGYVNGSVIHAYGSGTVTEDSRYQRRWSRDRPGSRSAAFNRRGRQLQPRDWFVNLKAIYGSGLTNGNPDGVAYKTGLFDFNTATHNPPPG